MSHAHNPEIDENAPDSGGAQRKPGRPRRKLLALVVAVLVMGVGTIAFTIGMRQKRDAFVGRVDPMSGVQCRFTLAADWKREDTLAGITAQAVPGYLEMDTFTSPPPSPIRKWITTHLFHPAASPWNVPKLYLTSLQTNAVPQKNAVPHYLRIQAGYPELLSLSGSITHRHLRIDGCPATMITVSDKAFRGGVLMVYVPNSSIVYEIGGIAAPQYATQIDHEMQEIVSSFHVEQGAVPSGGKGGGR